MSLHGVNQPIRQLGKGDYRSCLAMHEADEVALFADRFSVSASIYLEPPVGMVGFLFPRTASGQFLASGHNVGNDKLLVLPPGSATDIVMPEVLAGSEAIGIGETRFVELAERLGCSPKFVLTERLAMLAGNTAQLHALRRVVVDLVSHPEADPLGERISNVAANVITWMIESGDDRRTDLVNRMGVRSRVAKLAQAYIEEHYRGGIRLEDLCLASGVGIRTMQRCFREYFGVTVTEYVKTARLDAALRALSAAEPPSVSEVALQSGFTHLGRFSAEFRDRFGRLPREVARTGTPNGVRQR